jgi:hypothetical protein
MFLIFAAPMVFGQGAESAPGEPLSQEELEFFEKRVRPVLVERCFECHAGVDAKGGLRLDTRSGWMAGGDSGKAIHPNSPDQSLLITAIRYSNPDMQMPPSGALPPSEVAVLEEWVRRGAFDPRVDPITTQSISPTGMSLEAGRQFWSMQPISDPAIPLTKDSEWGRTPIDAFVLKQLESVGLRPAAPASRRDLLRRMTLGLTGLPPTAEETVSFEQDTAPESIDRAIDRLMSSPQYGVRFGRHWLDVVRYADSNGLDENIAFGNAWRYRDYVIDAFNRDKPFDRFLEEQIAGDLLPDANRETKTGTGFLVLGAKVLAEPDREKLVMDTIDEQLDTIGKAFLGMTLGCARCHDHKFDPIQQRDYYAMAAIFQGTKTFGDSSFGAIKHWNEVSYASPEELANLKTVNAEIASKQGAWNKQKNDAMQSLRERVRTQAAHYLAAAATISVDATLNECADVGKPHDLHPRVLAHCRKHLEFHRDDPLFAKWRELAERHDVSAIEKHYGALFASALTAWEELKKQNAGATRLGDEQLEAARTALLDVGGFLAIPAKMEHALDEETLSQLHASATELRLLESSAPDETSIMAVGDRQVIERLPIHIRGNHRNLGEMVDRGFPVVMCETTSKPIFGRRSSGRLELARWMAHSNHPLTARVIVNRVWRWHFGRGLVATTENFGQLGDRPSNPELLDYLARWFIASGWSIKELNRLIMSSSVYQMGSYNAESESAMAIDPENRWLWRYRAQRLSAEQIRDSILFAAGQLDLRLGDKMVPLRNRQFVFDHTSVDHTRYESPRRTMYLPVIRNHLYSLLEQFDFPDPTMPIGDRQTSTVAPQSLLLMNSEWILDAADQLAQQCEVAASTPEARVDWIFAKVLGRVPSQTERQRLLEFLASLDADPSANPHLSLGLIAQNLLICNEFFDVR